MRDALPDSYAPNLVPFLKPPAPQADNLWRGALDGLPARLCVDADNTPRLHIDGRREPVKMIHDDLTPISYEGRAWGDQEGWLLQSTRTRLVYEVRMVWDSVDWKERGPAWATRSRRPGWRSGIRQISGAYALELLVDERHGSGVAASLLAAPF